MSYWSFQFWTGETLLSIRQVHNLIEKTGCGTVVLVLIAGSMLAGLIFGQCSRSQQLEAERQGTGTKDTSVIATVGSRNVSALAIEESFAKSREQMVDQMRQFGSFEPLPIQQEMQLFLQSFSEAFQEVTVESLAKKYGVTISDTQLADEITRQIELAVSQERMQLVQQKKLKDNATAEEFDAALRASGRKTSQEYREDLKENAKNPAIQKRLRQGLVGQEVIKKLEAETTITDADLKKTLTMLTIKRIVVDKSDEAGRANLDKALAELKAGAKFDDLIKKYSRDKAVEPIPFSMRDAFARKELAELKTLQPGSASKIVEMTDGFAVVLVVTSKDNVPKDWEKSKANDLTSYKQYAASIRLQEEVKALQNSKDITWKSSGFKTAYEFITKAGSPEEKKVAEATIAVGADASDQVGRRALVYAKYLAIESLWSKWDAKTKQERGPQRLQILQDTLAMTESPALRLTLAEMLIDRKDPAAGAELLNAAKGNEGYLGPIGQGNDGQIATLLKKARDAKVVTPEQAKEIEAAQTAWQKAFQTQAAEQKKAEAEREKERLAAEAAAKKAEEEAKKNAPKGGTPPKAPTGPSSGNLLNPGAK